MKEESNAQLLKVNEELGVVFGYAMVSNVGGEPYYDFQGDHITEDAVLKSALDFSLYAGGLKEMHYGDFKGKVVFCFPLTAEVAKALGIQTEKTGLLIGVKVPPEILAKFKSGEYKGFSIGGRVTRQEAVQ